MKSVFKYTTFESRNDLYFWAEGVQCITDIMICLLTPSFYQSALLSQSVRSVLICLGSVIGRPGLIHCARRFYTLKQRISSYRSNLLPSNKIYYSLSQSYLLPLRHCNFFLVVGPHLNDDAVPIHCDILNKVSMLLYRTKGAPIHCWCPQGPFINVTLQCIVSCLLVIYPV